MLGSVLRVALILLLSEAKEVHGLEKSLDSPLVNPLVLDFAKDISSIIIESTLESHCEENVFVVTKECETYLDHVLISIRDWAPPVIIVSFKDSNDLSPNRTALWKYFLSWKRRPCSLIFVCDLLHVDRVGNRSNDTEFNLQQLTNQADIPEINPEGKLGYVNFPKFFTNLDQVIYMTEEPPLTDRENFDLDTRYYKENEAAVLQQTGVLLSVQVINRTRTRTGPVISVFSKCELCGPNKKQQETYLGSWERNKTQFGKYFAAFKEIGRSSLHNSHLHIGYFNYSPHFSCLTNKPWEGQCSGIEWEIIKQIGRSLEFNFSLLQLEADDTKSNISPMSDFISVTNYTGMIKALQEDKIDLAIGGISVTSGKISIVEFSNVFAAEPIVFVVKKPNNIFILGIWLAFQPEVWPFIFILVTIMSYLFRIIINRSLQPYSSKLLNSKTNISLSVYLEKYAKLPTRKPAHVRFFESLEITLQPLLGQPLTKSQISPHPGRLLKMLLLLWWFSCLIITTFYNTSLITSLINPVTSKYPQSLHDLVVSGYYFKLGCKKGSVYEVIITATEEVPFPPENSILELDGQKIPEEEAKMVKLLRQIRERLVVQDTNTFSAPVAYIVEESAVNRISWNSSEIGWSEIKVIRERLFLTGYGFALRPRAPYKDKIDTALARLSAGGLIDYWYARTGGDDKKKEPKVTKVRLRETLGQVNLDMKILQGAFIFLILGCFFAGIILLIEQLTKRYRFRVFTKEEFKRGLHKVGKGACTFYDSYIAEQRPPSAEMKEHNHDNAYKFRSLVKKAVELNAIENKKTDRVKMVGFLK